MTIVKGIDGTSVHYRVEGSGTDHVILVHGLGDDGSAWQPQVDGLGDRCRFLLVDLRGHGQSDRRVADLSVRAMAGDVVAAAQAAGFERAHVVGISLGGGVAFEVAIQAPDLVESLVIVNSTPTARIGGRRGRALLGIRKLMARFLTPAKAAPAIAKRLFPDPGQQDLRDDCIRRLSDNDPDAYRRSLNALVAFDRALESRSIQVPTLYVHSEHDYTPLAWRQPFVDAMPNARLVQIAGAHHAVTAEKPEQFNRVLADHLDHPGGEVASERPMLVLESVATGFGGNTVLHGVDLVVPRGGVSGILGLNGAGKSVTMKVVAGLQPAWEGRVIFDGQDITRLGPEERVDAGMAHITQGRQVFRDLTVEQNLRLGAYTLRQRTPERYEVVLASMYERFPRLRERRHQLAGTMSGGEQAMLAVARALMSEPKLLLVDEPSAGLAPAIVGDLFDLLRQVNQEGLTILLVEQNIAFALDVVDDVHVLQRGRIVYGGPKEELDRDELTQLLGIGRLLRASVGKAG